MTSDNVRDRLSLAAVSFGGQVKTGQIPLAEFLDRAAALGFSKVELCDRTVPDASALIAELDRRNLTMPTFAIRNDFTLDDPVDLRAQVEHVNHGVRYAAACGSTLVRVWSGTARTDSAASQRAQDCLAAVCEEAARLGVSVAIETHGGLSNSFEFMQAACSTVANLGVCVDFGNVGSPYRENLEPFLNGIATHVHVKALSFGADGRETAIPLDWALSRLATSAYGGVFAIEYEGPEPFESGILNTRAAVLRAYP